MTTVSVSQQEGEVVLTKPGDAPIVYTITKGKADVPDEDVAHFLNNVPGSQIVTGKVAVSAD
jgi:hypothetical protein